MTKRKEKVIKAWAILESQNPRKIMRNITEFEQFEIYATKSATNKRRMGVKTTIAVPITIHYKKLTNKR